MHALFGAYCVTQRCRQDPHTPNYTERIGGVKVQGGVELREGFGEEVTFGPSSKEQAPFPRPREVGAELPASDGWSPGHRSTSGHAEQPPPQGSTGPQC